MKLVQKWLRGGCVYFTVIALILTLIDFLSSSPGAISSSAFLLIFPAALTISGASMLLHSNALPRWGRILCHYLLTVSAIFVFLYLPTKETVQPMQALLMFLVFSIVYWILFLFIHILGGRIRRLMEID
ncbi:MAG: hypothetical protein IJX19_11800 [Clostridia bacterium]|nr:hypothetical protein [Clostridia bacterium]